MYEHTREAINSVLEQTYEDIQIIVVVDGNESLYERLVTAYGDCSDIVFHCNDKNIGLSGSRNNALKYVTGDVVALLDDDAIANERWIEELVDVYERRDAIAAGGKMIPLWVAGKPQFLPEEFYWLVGVTHRDFADPGEEVRNTFGSNISFKTDVLQSLGGFDTTVGPQGENNLQAEETLLCARMRQQYGQGVIYNPDAKVAHKVFEYRTEKRWLLERAFWQGYSKRAVTALLPDNSGNEESAFLKQLLVEFIPSRLRSFIITPQLDKLSQLIAIVLLTVTVGVGYGYGILREVVDQ